VRERARRPLSRVLRDDRGELGLEFLLILALVVLPLGIVCLAAQALCVDYLKFVNTVFGFPVP